MLSRPFLVLALTMFTATMGIGMVTPVLPVYAQSLGATGALIGLTFSAFAVTQVLISPFAGRLADRYGLRPFLLLGILVYVASAAGWWLSDSLAAAIAFRALSGVGSAFIFSLSQAYIGELAPHGMEGRYIGTFGIAEFIGFGIGPLGAGAIRDRADINSVFLSMAVLFAIAFVVVALFLPAQSRRGAASALPEGARPSVAAWGVILRHPGMQGLYAVRVAFACAMGASMSFIAVHLEESMLVSATLVGIVLAGQQVGGGIAQPLVGAVADRLPRRALVLLGAVMVAAGYTMTALSASYAAILIAFVAGVGIGGALVNVSAQAVQVALGRELGMASIAGLQSTGFAVGMVLGSLGGGLLVQWIGLRFVFTAGGAAILVGAALFLLRTRGLHIDAAVPFGEIGATGAALEEGAGEPDRAAL